MNRVSKYALIAAGVLLLILLLTFEKTEFKTGNAVVTAINADGNRIQNSDPSLTEVTYIHPDEAKATEIAELFETEFRKSIADSQPLGAVTDAKNHLKVVNGTRSQIAVSFDGHQAVLAVGESISFKEEQHLTREAIKVARHDGESWKLNYSKILNLSSELEEILRITERSDGSLTLIMERGSHQ